MCSVEHSSFLLTGCRLYSTCRCTSLMLLGPSSQYVVKKSLLVSLGTRERRPALCRLLSWWEANDMKAIHRQSLAIRLRDSCPMNPNKRNGSEWEAGHKLKDAGDNVCVLQSWELKTSRGPVVTKLDNLQEQRRSKRSCSESSLLSCDPRVKKATHSRKDSSILPFELTENILVRLPLRKLIQACTVCKEWRSVIQSESFRDLRRRQELDAPDDDAYQLMLFAYDGVDWLWSGFDFTSKRLVAFLFLRTWTLLKPIADGIAEQPFDLASFTFQGIQELVRQNYVSFFVDGTLSRPLTVQCTRISDAARR